MYACMLEIASKQSAVVGGRVLLQMAIGIKRVETTSGRTTLGVSKTTLIRTVRMVPGVSRTMQIRIVEMVPGPSRTILTRMVGTMTPGGSSKALTRILSISRRLRVARMVRDGGHPHGIDL